MRSAWTLAFALSLAAAPALGATHPSRLADQVDPSMAADADCAAAMADAQAWDEKRFSSTLVGAGRIAVWPLAENKRRRDGLAKNEARERIMERLRTACFAQPPLSLVEPARGQRWPGGEGYNRTGGFDIIVGGREVSARAHPQANVLLVKARGGGPGSYLWEDAAWLRTVGWALEPTGCGVSQIQRVDEMAHEVAFVCPAGVDLRQLIAVASPLVRRGAWPKAPTTD